MPTIVKSKHRPTGRDQVRQAVLEAAVRLFESRGPTSVSLRDIAAEAGVNLGLLHRHFGNKAEVVTAALAHVVATGGARTAEAFAAENFTEQAARLATGRHNAYGRMLAWSILDGADPSSLQKEYPGSDRLVERLRTAGWDDESARVGASTVVALALGWSLFGPWLHVATGLGRIDHGTLRAGVAALIERLVAHPL